MNEITKKVVSIMTTIVPVAFLCGVSYYAGGKLNSTVPNGKYLTVDKSGVILNAVFDNPAQTPEERKANISDPIISVLKKYADMGYVIIEAGADERGMHAIAALPPNTKDITDELIKVVTDKKTENDIQKNK